MERNSLVKTKEGKNFLLPFILITSLFFLWGFAHSILDVLNKHYQDTMEIKRDRKSTRLNSSHVTRSNAVYC